jgi:tetratricopeptide (TPR) repeat protein
MINTTQKTFFSLLLAFLISLSSQAQQTDVNYGENPDECKKNLTIMLTYYKQKSYRDAARTWRWCFKNCPESSKNIYIVGEKIMKNFMSESKEDKALRSTYIDTLLMMYDKRLKHFSNDDKGKIKILESKGKALAQFRINESYEEAFNLLETVVTSQFPKVKSTTAKSYMYSVKIMHKKGKLSCYDVIQAYLKTMEIVDANIDAKPKKYQILKEKSIKYADACLDCDLLDSLYSTNFESSKNDTLWLDGGIELLKEKKCYKKEILVKMLEKRFESAPSSKTAITLAKYFSNKQNKTKALSFFDKAITLEKDSSELEKHLIKKAKFQNNTSNYSGARTTANKIIKLNPQAAKAYLIIGNSIIYGSPNCKSLTFGGAEVFWVAVDYFNKAARLAKEPKTKAKALEKADKYSAYFPAKNAIFLKSLNPGDSYKVECWINASTTIREKK